VGELKIGIIGAMDEEIIYMKESLDIYGESVFAQNKFYEGTHHHKEVVLCKSGVGKVNAAITTQILIDRFQVTHILFTGVAGALDPALEVGDIVISSSALQHDIDASALSPDFPKGTIPMFPFDSEFKADAILIKLAEAAAENLSGPQVKVGKVLSGDQFIADRELVENYRTVFNGSCIEMEGSAVGQACFLNEVPFVIIRSISDKANGEAPASFGEFTALAARRSSDIVESIIESL
jgi:adenosylhomocysteine nucleosidase